MFSFFLPEFVAAGATTEAAVAAPEAQLATAYAAWGSNLRLTDLPWRWLICHPCADRPLLVGFLNGATALIRHGLNNCDGGFGGSRGCPSRWQPQPPRADGYLTWRPTSGGGGSSGSGGSDGGGAGGGHGNSTSNPKSDVKMQSRLCE